MMEQSYGKLILTQQGGPEQEYELGKASITLGRAMTNDIILSDARASRSHARLECGPSGCKIIDLGSSNGTRVNGLRVDQVELKPGDTINLGNSQFRFEVAPSSFEDMGMTMIDSEADLDLTLDREILPVSVHETSTPSLVVFTSEKTWEFSLEDIDSASIGRTEGNQVVIDHEKVSRRHAEVVRKRGIFILRDLGSTNGTWHKNERIDELILQDGDIFRIGQAQLVFKSGFGAEALTMADESLVQAPARRPVVFVPGLMGSELWLGNERVWPNIKQLFKNPELFRYPSSIPLEPRGIVDEVVIVPNLIKMDQYNRLGDYLVEDLGYERGKDFFEFAYDWRQDVRLSARQLGEMIDTLPKSQPVTIIAHSLGTMVSRYYIERLDGKKRVERVILMGGPHQGAVKGLTSLLIAPEILPFGLMGERFRQLSLTFPTSFQIIPTYPCAIDQNGKKINFLEDESWVSEEHRPMLRAARQFRQELGRRTSIPALSIFGYGIKTIAGITLKCNDSGKLTEISYKSEPSGDSSVLEKSAVLEGTDIHPVQQYHGSLFVDSDVKMRLKLELARQFST
jgi:pSer/pThr/pTyr-binding forkhead associated (FHA) protein